jgi:alcohol dehydrogenase YqhD (iron-dependent ADH family)
MTDQIAEALMRVVIEFGPRLLKDPTDYEAQSEVMWAGSLSHNGITGLGRTADFSVHGLGHELSGMFDVSHGASLTTMWGSWARRVKDVKPCRFARLGAALWGTTTADECIEKTENFFKSIGMPTNFTELGIGVQSPEVVQKLADGAVFGGARKVGSFYPMDEAMCNEIYLAANV